MLFGRRAGQLFPNRPDRAGEPLALVHHLIQRLNNSIHFFIGDDERREEFNDFLIVARDLGQDVLAGVELHDDGLSEEAFLRAVKQRPGRFEFQRARGAEFDRGHQSFAPDIVDELVFVFKRLQAGQQTFAMLRRTLHQVFLFDNAQCRESRYHRQGILCERGRMDNASIQSAENSFIDRV